MEKVLIIGNLGYIGPVLENKLNGKFEIHGYDIGYFSNDYSLKNNFEISNRICTQHFGDVRRFNYDLLNGIDKIVYLAAISNDPMGNLFQKPTEEINQGAAIKIAKEAKARGVKTFIFASSCSVYGTGGSRIKNEKSDLDPLTNYAKSKINSEIELKLIADSSFNIRCFRFATACGFSPRLRLDLVLNDFVASALLYNRIDILSDGTPWRPLINVKDMSLAIEWGLLNKEDIPDFIVCNVGSNEWNFTVEELANYVKDIIPGTSLNINKNANPDKRSYKVDFNLFKSLAPDYYPKMTIEKTIKELVNGIEKMEFDVKNFRESYYIRLNRLKYLMKMNLVDNNLIASHK